MAEPATQNHVRDWLGSSDGMSILHQTAKSVHRYLSIYRIHPHFFNPHDPSDGCIEEIHSELVRFILESDKMCHALTGASAFNAKYLRQSFIHRCIDLARASGNDDFRDIAFPHQLAFDGWLNHLTHKRFLLPVLQYFWESVSRMWDNQPVWIELRAAAHWLTRFVATEGSRQVQFSDEAMIDGMSDEDLTTAGPQEPSEFHFRKPGTDAWFDPDQVNCWASIFPKRLSDAEKAVFYLRHCIERELKAIAQQLGYKSASGTAYPLKKAEEKLAAFAADHCIPIGRTSGLPEHSAGPGVQ